MNKRMIFNKLKTIKIKLESKIKITGWYQENFELFFWKFLRRYGAVFGKNVPSSGFVKAVECFLSQFQRFLSTELTVANN